jgi:hypothetical protein
MPTLRPYRDYAEKDVIQNASYSGTLPANRGLLVKYARGFVATDEPLEMLGDVGAHYNNTVSQRWGAYAKIATCTTGDTSILGIMLMDVRETDENGLPLKFDPIKLAELDAVLSGQTVPVATKGTFHYSGAVLASQTPAAHTRLYPGVSGELSTGNAQTGSSVGFCLGGKDTNGCVMIRLNIT